MDPVILSSNLTLGLLGLIFGGGLAYASIKFAVKSDPRIAMIVEFLPGANCGGCGFPGCQAFAEAVLKGEAPVTGCNPGGKETADKIAKLLGVELGDMTPPVAMVRCQGGHGIAKDRFEYSGIQSCAIAHHGGPKTHGQSDRHRAPGSRGSTTTPGRVFKGARGPGHMGDDRITAQNLRIVLVDLERNLIGVVGSVPGPRGGLVLIREARKQ